MTNVQIRGLKKAFNEHRRSANEQARELAHLRYRSYRGVPMPQYNWVKDDVHGTFTYRGVSYTK